MFRPNDIIFTDTGTFSMGLAFSLLPKVHLFIPNHYGDSLAGQHLLHWAPFSIPVTSSHLSDREGAHQLTMQEISQFARFGLKPIIFVLNNDGYLIERLFCKEPEYYYNDVAQWNYAQLPLALGCDDWYAKK